MLYHLTCKVSFDKADFMSIPFEAVTKPFNLFLCLFSFFMYNAGSSTLFLALGGHYVCSHALVMLLLILQMVVAFLLYPFKN